MTSTELNNRWGRRWKETTHLPGKTNCELGQARPELGEGVRGLSVDGSLEFYLNCRYFKAWKWVLAEFSLSFSSDGRFCWQVGRKRDKRGTRKQCWGWNCVHSLESPDTLAPATYIWIWFNFEDLSHLANDSTGFLKKIFSIFYFFIENFI